MRTIWLILLLILSISGQSYASTVDTITGYILSDFRLKITSPAKDTGYDVSAITTTDFDGGTRPANVLFDGGAFEYGSVDVSPPILSNWYPVSGTYPYYITSVGIGLQADDNILVSGCKYNATDVAYASMSGSLSLVPYSNIWTGSVSATSGVSRNYYARCIDSSGNESTPGMHISFSVATAPPQRYSYNGSIIHF